MVRCSQAVLILAQQYRVPAKVIQQMITDQALDLDKLTNGSQEPDGLITIPEAAEKYHLTQACIRTWIGRGKLDCMSQANLGFGHGTRFVVNEEQVVKLVNNPPRPGRPPKTAASEILTD